MRKFIAKDKLNQFLRRIEGEVFVPQKKDNYFLWQRYPCDFSLEGFRATLPPKFFFYSPCEVLKEKKMTKRTVIGIKVCDLKAILFLKKVFKEGDVIDPFFRDDILIISADCTYVDETCFCVLLGDNPYPEENFDLNLSEVEEGFVAEIKSKRGEMLIEDNADLFSPVDSEKLKEIKKRRNEVKRAIKGKKIELVGKKIEVEDIKEYIEKCVSCGACTYICPACFCFLLDEKSNFEKVRFWDSCQHPGYARVAGGANPLKKLDTRFVHRIKDKFEYSLKRVGIRSCFGCGRCINACIGGINFSEVLSKLS